jgi:hypothetical protein
MTVVGGSGVEVLDGRQVSPSNVLGRTHYPP